MRRALAMFLVLGLAGCSDGGDGRDGRDGEAAPPGRPDAPDAVQLRVAANDPDDRNIAVKAFLPRHARVPTGSTVEWSFPGPERHTVTFLPAGQARPAPDVAPTFAEPTEPADGFDGTALANSGLRPRDRESADRFRLRFTRAGEFAYVCVVHPSMEGTITVTDAAPAAEPQAAIRERGDREYETYLAEGRAAKRTLLATRRTPTPGPEGEPTWTIETGTSTEHTEVLAFLPPALRVGAGDRIVFVNNSALPHTATFGGSLVPRDADDPAAGAPAPGPSPQPIVDGVLLNTGVLAPTPSGGAPPPETDRTFTFFATRPGAFAYVCVIHRSSGMTGSIAVA